jgi:copper chaperone
MAITTTYTVDGMTCDHCVRSVTGELSALPDVTGVRVDLASGRVSVESTRPLTKTDVAAAVEEAGYALR